MRSMALAQARRRPGRTAALLLSIAVAATGFSVLTATATTARQVVVGEVERNFRPSYDLLVRPVGSRTPLERERGLVRPNTLAGIAGGITFAQYDAVRALPEVEVAAPVAMIGATLSTAAFVPVDMTAFVGPAGPEVLRARTTWSTDRGLTRISDEPSYLFVSDRPFVGPVFEGAQAAAELDPSQESTPVREVGPSGPGADICGDDAFKATGPFDPQVRSGLQCWSRATSAWQPNVRITFSVPFVLAAVDPEQEALLSGLDAAIVSGRSLRPDDKPYENAIGGSEQVRAASVLTVPVLVAADAEVDQRAEVVVERLPSAAVDLVRSGQGRPEVVQTLRDLPGTAVGDTAAELRTAYGSVLTSLQNSAVGTVADGYWAAGPTALAAAGDGSLRAVSAPPPPDTWRSEVFQGYVSAPPTARDDGYRSLEHRSGILPEGPTGSVPHIAAVGTYDPALLPEVAELAAVSTGLYETPSARGADAASRALLGGQDLLPDGNPAGYLSTPPGVVTTLDALPVFRDPARYADSGTDAPLSVIRVRISGLGGPDEDSRARLRQAAERIGEATGLEVDVVAGSSVAPVTVTLPAGQFGRPELRVQEGWSRLGVAYSLIEAQDRKSQTLFTLILVVCALFVTNSVAAAVRSRTAELAVLGAVGWPPWRLGALVLGEAGAVGAAAGGLGTLAAVPIAARLGVDVPWTSALLAWPAAVALALLAALQPAFRAARQAPVAGLRPAVLRRRRARRVRTVVGMALSDLGRRPGRLAVATAALGIAAAATTVLAGLVLGFRGEVVGTLLGDALAVRARPADVAAVITMGLLALIAVADVLYLDMRERASEIGALRAAGWGPATVARLVVAHGAAIGLIGSCAGAALGLAAVAGFADTVPRGLVLAAGAVLVIGTVAAAVAAAIPAWLIGRTPVTQQLAVD